jgi:undecaprenyl diphosphate synthase
LNSDLPAAAAEAGRDPGLPAHVAIIMDGNGRWAQKRLLSRIKGHEKGSEAVRAVARSCRELGVPFLTLYAFSTENWLRPRAEVEALMGLLKRFLATEREEMVKNGIRLNAIGHTERLPADVREAVARSVAETQGGTGLQLNLALSYGGRDEITRAVRTVAEQVRDGRIAPEAITEEFIADQLDTRGMPDPDILIRTGGDMRISNFLLWQLAYTEIFVTPTLWPDFDRNEFLRILKEYSERERRFGRLR